MTDKIKRNGGIVCRNADGIEVCCVEVEVGTCPLPRDLKDYTEPFDNNAAGWSFSDNNRWQIAGGKLECEVIPLTGNRSSSSSSPLLSFDDQLETQAIFEFDVDVSGNMIWIQGGREMVLQPLRFAPFNIYNLSNEIQSYLVIGNDGGFDRPTIKYYIVGDFGIDAVFFWATQPGISAREDALGMDNNRISYPFNLKFELTYAGFVSGSVATWNAILYYNGQRYLPCTLTLTGTVPAQQPLLKYRFQSSASQFCGVSSVFSSLRPSQTLNVTGSAKWLVDNFRYRAVA